jgi:hypothetical protein
MILQKIYMLTLRDDIRRKSLRKVYHLRIWLNSIPENLDIDNHEIFENWMKENIIDIPLTREKYLQLLKMEADQEREGT